MKALFVSNDPSIFDSASAARARMRSYADRMEELHIVSAAPMGAREEQDGNLYLHPVHSWKIRRVRTLAARAHALVLEHSIDIVSAQDPFEHGLAALFAIRGTEAKLHIQVHTDFLSFWFIKSGNWRSPRVRMPLLNRYRRRLADRVLPRAHGIRVVSERVKNSLLERYDSRVSLPTVIPIAVDSVLPPRVELPAHPFTFALICVGRLEPEKRIEDILAALKLVVPKYPMIGLCIVGSGRDYVRLERMTRRLELSSHVIFINEWLPAEKAWGMMQSAQAFIQASAYEGYGRTLIEAALARVPIITTDVGIVGEVFTGYHDVLSVPVADPTALSLSIVGFIEDNAVRHQLPIEAEAAARAHLAAVGDVPTRVVEDLEETLNRL